LIQPGLDVATSIIAGIRSWISTIARFGGMVIIKEVGSNTFVSTSI
jgi:hypothetical protein